MSQTILAALGYALLTGFFNLLLGHKSQIEAWAERNPRLAAVLKFTRAIGLDPWNLIAALSLAFQKKLPKAQKTDDTARIIPGGPLLVLLFLACMLQQQGCATPPIAPDVCSKVSLATIVAGCEARKSECSAGDAACPVYLECKRAIRAWKDCP